MRRKFGTLMMVLGVLLMAASASLMIFNHRAQQQAKNAAEEILPLLTAQIPTESDAEPDITYVIAPTIPAAVAEESHPPREMAVADIGGYGYIGYLSIPSLGLELPVMADWSYPQLRIAPCRYSGNLFADDLVIMAHNYWGHFGQLSKLNAEDTVLFTDMEGTQHTYQVVLTDLLTPGAVEEMTSGDFDLTLFTCTYGGQNRVTIRCDHITK